MTSPIFDEQYQSKYRAFTIRLVKARKEAGLTQVNVANSLETTQSTISKYERGDLRLDVVQLMEFARLYGKPINFFVEDLGNEKEHA